LEFLEAGREKEEVVEDVDERDEEGRIGCCFISIPSSAVPVD
jgi:hypothetical protein